MAGIEISQIVQISERAGQMRAAGESVIALSTGEPDLPTPDPVIAAAHAAARNGQTRYTPTAGTAALRKAVGERAGVGPEQVVISTGAKQVLANAMLATLDAGDEVIIPTPYWTSYSDIVAMAGGVPITLPCSMADGFKLQPGRLAAAIKPRTRWLMLNSPCNPSAAIYAADEIAALARVLEAHPHVWVLSDEIYQHLSYRPFVSFADAAPQLTGRTLIVNGVSKAWSMTGWRIGWGIGPAPLIKAMTAVQGQVTSGTSSIGQAAALEAVTGNTAFLDDRRSIFAARRAMVVDVLNAIPGITCPEPEGTFYVFPNIEGLMAAGGFATCGEACAWLLETAKVALVPGAAFGLPGHARLSFAYSEGDLTEGLKRIAAAVARLTTETRKTAAAH